MRNRFREKNERGYVLVLVALSSSVLVLMVGFAVDLGNWYLSASRLQSAADAAALAGSSKMPDENAAIAAATEAYAVNGYRQGINNIDITFNPGGTNFRTSLTNKKAPTYFIQSVMPSLSISRSSKASAPGDPPAMGSPFNVLGTGDLNIPGIPKQNFWLAVNGSCSPKEDGDYFAAQYDRTKGPWLDTVDPVTNERKPALNGKTKCTGNVNQNVDLNENGYSYYISVPPAPHAGDYVDVSLYDPMMDVQDPSTPHPPDQYLGMPADPSDNFVDTAFQVFNANDTLKTQNDDVEMTPHPIGFTTKDPRFDPNTWVPVQRIPYEAIKNGGLFRVQVFPVWHDGQLAADGSMRGINAFSIGAFASWEGSGKGCDSRTDDSCPRTFANQAMSTFNNLSDKSGVVPFYFAEINDRMIGSTFDVMLWDVAEGVSKLQLLGPDGTPLNFDWSVVPNETGLSGSGTEVNTDRLDNPIRDGVSNAYTFNDRLLQLRVTIPNTYRQMIQNANGDQWLRLAYTVNSSPNDRTTWGLVSADSGTGVSHLVRDQ